MQAQAAEFPGYAGKFDCFLRFRENSYATVCLNSFILKQALKQTRSVCFRAS